MADDDFLDHLSSLPLTSHSQSFHPSALLIHNACKILLSETRMAGIDAVLSTERLEVLLSLMLLHHLLLSLKSLGRIMALAIPIICTNTSICLILQLFMCRIHTLIFLQCRALTGTSLFIGVAIHGQA
jgi:hypothetical protein